MAKNYLTNNRWHWVFHFILFNAVWFFCVISASLGYQWMGLFFSLFIVSLQFLWQRFFVKRFVNCWRFLVYITIIGFFGDTILFASGLLTLRDSPFIWPFSAPFLIGIWLCFAMTFYATLGFLAKNTILLSVLTFFGFMVAYYAGALFGVATISNAKLALFSVGIYWAFILPVAVFFFNKKWPLTQE